MMKAHAVMAHGPASEVFRILDVSLPKLNTDDVLLKVYYTSVNPLDCKIRVQSNGVRSFPLLLGFDVCGEVVAKGSNTLDLEIGMIVMASPSVFRAGANAEYVAVAASKCLPIGSVDPKLAAALPLVGITAYEALFHRLKVQPRDTLLIHAGAGGVGHIALQLAKIIGCRVITTASRTESIDFCNNVWGADHVVNYKSSHLKEAIDQVTQGQGLSYILDTVGGATFTESLSCLAPNGHICTILPTYFDAATAYHNLLKNITISYEFMGVEHTQDPYRQRKVLEQLLQFLKKGLLLPHISNIYTLDELPLAHHELEQGHTTGKILIKACEFSHT